MNIRSLPPSLRHLFPIPAVVGQRMDRMWVQRVPSGTPVWIVDIDPNCSSCGLVKTEPNGSLPKPEVWLRSDLLDPVDPVEHDLRVIVERVRIALRPSSA